MNKRTFPIILQKEKDGGYSVSNVALEGCYSQGETVEEAKENLKDAISLILNDRTEDIKRGLPDDAIQETIAF